MPMDDKSRLTKACLILAGRWVYLIFSSLTASPALAAKEMRPLEIKQRYTQVLGILAAGDFDRAVTDLVQFEQAAVGDQQPWRYVDTLWKSKLHVIRDLLAGHDVDLLMPIIVLHHDAYFRYSEMGRRHLAQHSRTMSVELADILAERSGTPAAKSFAGWTLVSFAAYLWSPSNIGLSADLFYRAHLLDPGNELALAGLAAAWERSGGYEKAIETLTKALRLRGADPELLLRLALCNLRDPKGAHEQALAQLSSLTRAEAPGWIRSVAYQELARAGWPAMERAVPRRSCAKVCRTYLETSNSLCSWRPSSTPSGGAVKRWRSSTPSRFSDGRVSRPDRPMISGSPLILRGCGPSFAERWRAAWRPWRRV